MKCPYRKKTKIYGTETQEYYMDCVGEECPFYAPKGSFNADKAFCKRAETELSGTGRSYL